MCMMPPDIDGGIVFPHKSIALSRKSIALPCNDVIPCSTLDTESIPATIEDFCTRFICCEKSCVLHLFL